ncbi:MAG: malate dehydrogenase [Methanomicrobium sp.]|uniref:malate dehydrogenase n=1 Tax=Methanomicrobium mobile TaxID=2205 RepID=UPI0005B2AE98|nr:malate dehydrogenase [Methanomicrobium mobile]MBP5083632.1 malate dehydrogenase [Methanomicrobium sp.]MBP5475784.1 malate dehydrogenase [Methanomicrobium sp.]
MAKVTIIGASGKVGQFAAYSISAIPYVKKMLLFGRKGNEDVLEGTKWDFIDNFAALGRDVMLQWSCDPKDLEGSDIVIITAGIPRRAGQDRLDLAKQNAVIIAKYSRMIAENAPDSIIFVVSNPVDVMTSVALKYSGFPQNRVFGLGTHLDSMRLKSFVAHHFKVHVSEVHTRIIGEHGASMVPLWSATTIGGIQISNLPKFDSLPKEEMVHWVLNAGSHIIEKSGATIYGPGAAIATLVKTVLGDENRILSVSAYVNSEVHGIGNVSIGVPARINRKGVFPVSIMISEDEVNQFKISVEKIKAATADVMNGLDERIAAEE